MDGELDFSRIEAGRMEALYEPTDLATLTAELASNFGSAADRAGLTLIVDCSPLCEPIYVDREMWEKIVLNLLSNAFKHTFEGRITVRLRWIDCSAELTVEDSGVGIAAAELPRLFDRFHRVKGAPSRTHEGTGIGLALVQELVHLHLGTVRVESEVGRGTRFIVTLVAGTAHLPSDKVAAQAQVPATSRRAEPYVQEALHWSVTPIDVTEAVQLPDSGSVPAPRLPRARVLLVDDNADMRRYVARLLSDIYEVIAVGDGQEALDAVRAAPPDLVLSDVMMPRLDGFGLVRALRADERTRTLPIILLSARAGEEAAVESLGTGADDYLVKPFSARELLARVRTHVELASERRAWQSELERRVEERTAELRLAQQAALQQERLSALGQMASGIAHDINNAIAPIGLYVESLLESDPALSPKAQYLPIILRAIEDVAATVGRMREFYRARAPQLTLLPLALNLLVDQVIDLTRARWSDMPQQRGVVIDVVRQLQGDLPAVAGIESEVREALTNLIFNAVDAMLEGGTLILATRTVDGCACLEVGDSGIGMDEETSRRCLEPFFTTKGERGTGLGLAMVYGFVRRHGAEIQIDSAPGQGTRIRILFPVSKAGSATDTGTRPASARPTNLRVLLVDDDPLVLDSLRETLEAEGHVIVTAQDAREGVAAFLAAQITDPFGLVITDLGMPHLDGSGVTKAIKEASPRTPVILLTGWGARPDAEVPPQVDRVLGKPVRLRELRTALAECCSETEQKANAVQ